MKILSPSYYAYIIRMLQVLNLINTRTASLFWPLVKITAILGIISVLLKYVCYSGYQIWELSYLKSFYLPITDNTPTEYMIYADIFSVFLKLHLLKHFPPNDKYALHSLLFFVCYVIFGLGNSNIVQLLFP